MQTNETHSQHIRRHADAGQLQAGLHAVADAIEAQANTAALEAATAKQPKSKAKSKG